ncbi:hypothetical protein M0R45_030533 [Rubus argutus]|uniref:Uncharacterized protein n=1 Tax=Rubus argutus TaxID=59490 RepID=A0AAW1WBP8_RUBAR
MTRRGGSHGGAELLRGSDIGCKGWARELSGIDGVTDGGCVACWSPFPLVSYWVMRRLERRRRSKAAGQSSLVAAWLVEICDDGMAGCLGLLGWILNWELEDGDDGQLVNCRFGLIEGLIVMNLWNWSRGRDGGCD